MHTEDILCMTLVEPGLLATASYDGDVIVIKRDTGNVIFKLNACLSRYPINSHNLGEDATQYPPELSYFLKNKTRKNSVKAR